MSDLQQFIPVYVESKVLSGIFIYVFHEFKHVAVRKLVNENKYNFHYNAAEFEKLKVTQNKQMK